MEKTFFFFRYLYTDVQRNFCTTFSIRFQVFFFKGQLIMQGRGMF